MDEKYIGFLKYSGETVKEGLLDARLSGEALLGFNELFRYFITQEDPSFRTIEFELPVRIKKGTWEIAIPEAISTMAFGIGGVGAGAYALALAKKGAEDGFLESGPARDISKTIKASIVTIQWVIKIATHLGKFTKERLNAKIRKEDNLIFIDITNSKSEILSVPEKYFNAYSQCPPKIFSRNAAIIDNDKTLHIGIYESDQIEEIIIRKDEKLIFYTPSSDEVLFPELKHGASVKLEGEITRINELTNTAGFKYQDHILTIIPERGSIVAYKKELVAAEATHIFPNVTIIGRISRLDIKGTFKDKKPRITFTNLEQKHGDRRLSLLDSISEDED